MVNIREPIKEDCIAIEIMIKELGDYENRKDGPNGPKIDRKILEKECFGEQKLLRIMVAEEEDSKQLIGYALYFFKFSTYTGKILYLEDLFVKPDYRHLGGGRQLLIAVTKEAAKNCCDSIEWSCIDWNHNSIKFYKKFGAQEQPESKGWLSFKLDKQQIDCITEANKK